MTDMNDFWFLCKMQPDLGKLLFESQYPELYEIIDNKDSFYKGNRTEFLITVNSQHKVYLINKYLDSKNVSLKLSFSDTKLYDFSISDFIENIKISEIDLLQIDSDLYIVEYFNIRRIYEAHPEITIQNQYNKTPIYYCKPSTIEYCFYYDEYYNNQLLIDGCFESKYELDTNNCNLSSRKQWKNQSKKSIDLYNFHNKF